MRKFIAPVFTTLNRVIVFRILVCLLLLAALSQGRASSDEPVKRPLLVAHYMPWFEAKPTSLQWGWHWTMNAFDPEKKTQDRRSIASHYYPLIGPYDSSDPTVIEYHLLLMKTAGIDGIIVDWYGMSDLYDYPALHRNTRLLFECAAKCGLLVGICYEDQTITKLVEAKRLSGSDRIKHAKGEMDWVRENWFSKPAYLKLNGKPVLLSFGSEGLKDDEWEQIFSSKNDAPIYLSEHKRRSAASGTFDWPQPQIGLASLNQYYKSVEAGTISMPVAFPRFNDIYKEAKVQDGYPQIPDDQGRTFAMTLERAVKSGAHIVQIATWNDWGEGTAIEPSKEFGYRDLETIQRLRSISDTHFFETLADLRLPQRLWQLRSRQTQRPELKTKLDGIALLLASGKVFQAGSALKQLELTSERNK